VTIPAAETVTHFQFAEDEVAVGDGIFANVDVGGLHGSGSTTNGPELERAIGWYIYKNIFSVKTYNAIHFLLK
jgi:hypothetical protein